MNRKQITATIAAGAAGLAAAVALALPATASAYTPDQLPALGYAVSVLNLGNNCHDWTATGYGASKDLGSDCDAGFQQTLDDFVNATWPGAQTTAATTTAPATTTQPADTTTTATDTQPTVTAPATTTAAQTPSPAPAPAPTAPATTAPTTTAPTACDVQCQIANLQAQIDALRGELTQLEQILQAWPSLDPGILAELMTVGS